MFSFRSNPNLHIPALGPTHSAFYTMTKQQQKFKRVLQAISQRTHIRYNITTLEGFKLFLKMVIAKICHIALSPN